MIDIHISDVLTFKKCRRLWNWSSHLRGNLEPSKPYLPFFEGLGVHHAMQEMYDLKRNPVESFRDWAIAEVFRMKEELTPDQWRATEPDIIDAVARCKSILRHYASWAKKADEDLEVFAIEISPEKPLPLIQSNNSSTFTQYNDSDEPEIGYSWRLDGVVRKKSDGTYWTFEHKTCRSIEEKKSMLANDEQALAYLWATEKHLGVPISGVIYNLLRKKAPTVAQELASKPGQLSQNKSIDTTFEFYKSQLDEMAAEYADTACKTGQQDMADTEEMWTEVYKARKEALYAQHKEILEHLYQKGNTFFERYELRRTPAQIAQGNEDLIATALDMVESPRIYPTGGQKHCIWCNFREPCLVMNAGGAYEVLLDRNYKPRKGWKEDLYATVKED